MPCNFSELKSGGTIPMLSPKLKSGGRVPHSSTDRRPCLEQATIFLTLDLTNLQTRNLVTCSDETLIIYLSLNVNDETLTFTQ